MTQPIQSHSTYLGDDLPHRPTAPWAQTADAVLGSVRDPKGSCRAALLDAAVAAAWMAANDADGELHAVPYGAVAGPTKHSFERAVLHVGWIAATDGWGGRRRRRGVTHLRSRRAPRARSRRIDASRCRRVLGDAAGRTRRQPRAIAGAPARQRHPPPARAPSAEAGAGTPPPPPPPPLVLSGHAASLTPY